MSNEPTVQVLRKMNVMDFALESASYRLEAIVMFALAFMSLVCAVLVNLAKKESHYTGLTEQQELELTRIDEENPRMKKVIERRKQLSMVKKINRKIAFDNKTKRNELSRIYIKDLTSHYERQITKAKMQKKLDGAQKA